MSDPDIEEISVNGKSYQQQGNPRKKLKIEPSAAFLQGTDSPGSCSTGSESPMSVQSPPTPMPHTPLFSPSSNNSQQNSPSSSSSIADGVMDSSNQDLPQELYKIGWRRFWSEREGRFYYFNKFTQESRWDLLASVQKTNQENNNKRPSVGGAAAASAGQIYKNYVPSNEWNVNLPTNVKILERVPFGFYPPHPEMEILRINSVLKLRLYLTELCQTKEGVDLPLDSFNRWMMERKITDYGREPCLPCDCPLEISPSLTKDLLNVLPVKMNNMTTIPEARKLLSKYAEAAKKIVDTRNVSSENKKLVKWHCQSTFEWLRGSQFNAKFDEYMSRFRFLRGRCQSVLMETIKPNVDFICSRVYNHAREEALNVQAEHRKMLESCGVHVTEQPLPPPKQDKLVSCYSAQLRYRWPRLPDVQMEQTKDDLWVKLTFKQETLKINAAHFYKLEQMYKHNCFDDRKFDFYLARVWCLLKRYQCLFGLSQSEGSHLQQSLPRKVFESLNEDFGVTFECFASPLNSYFRQFCSLYADTDGFFGSRGSFFNFNPTSGSFEMNPPDCESIINAAVDRVEQLLQQSKGPMSFVTFLPEWNDPVLSALETINSSRFKRAQITVQGHHHFYKSGLQHLLTNGPEMCAKSSYPTVISVLQNDSGYSMWPPDDIKMQKLADYFSQF